MRWPLMMMSRRTLLAAAAPLLAAATEARPAEPFTVILDWLLDTNHAALFAAQYAGCFARHGLAVRLIAPTDPDTPPRLLAAGQADLAISYGDQLNLLVAAGLPVRRVGTLVASPLNTLIALPGAGIGGLAALKGRTIGYSVSGVEEALIDAMIATAGLSPRDVTKVRVNYDMIQALLSGRLDAATGAFRNLEVLQLRQMGHAPSVFLPEQHGVPAYDELILLARASAVTDPKLNRFLAALTEATALLRLNPDLFWRGFAAAHPELATPLNQASWGITVPLLAAAPAKLDAARYLAFQDFAVARGIAAHRLPLADFAVQIDA